MSGWGGKAWMKEWDKSKGWTEYPTEEELEYYGSGTGGKSKKALKSNWKSCWETKHKPIQILNGEVFGGACSDPQDGYDIYIGFDHSMKLLTAKKYPWLNKKGPVEFLFPIPDMSVPKDVKNFKAMIKWMVVQLEDGLKIQIGCIGGHGRTGTVLAALAIEAGVVKKNAIQWVRKNHCKKAVESASQIKFLMKHYGVSTAEEVKTVVVSSGFRQSNYKGGPQTTSLLGKTITASSMPSKGSIW